MGYIIIGIFTATVFFALFEEKIIKYRTPLYIFIFFLLVLVAGFREIGIDPDSIDYENAFLYPDSPNLINSFEYSFILISRIINTFTNDVHILFLFYALLGVGLKMYAFRKISSIYFLPLLIYISYYYVLHECIQIRTGVLSGLLLIAIYQIGENHKWKGLFLLLLGCFFHYSAIILFPIIFLSNNEMSKNERKKWVIIVFASYLIYYIGITFVFDYFVYLPYIGSKIEAYKTLTEMGNAMAHINIFGPQQLFTIFLFLYIIYFYDTIKIYNIYLPLLIKMFAIGLIVYIIFSFLPVFSSRVSLLFEVVTIILYSNIYYTIRPKWAAIGVIFILGLFNLYLSLNLLKL